VDSGEWKAGSREKTESRESEAEIREIKAESGERRESGERAESGERRETAESREKG
jgi:hypothetical protein